MRWIIYPSIDLVLIDSHIHQMSDPHIFVRHYSIIHTDEMLILVVGRNLCSKAGTLIIFLFLI